MSDVNKSTDYKHHRKVVKLTKPSVLSLYSGAGGMDLGFHKAGFKNVFANDFDKDAVETFNALIPGKSAIHADVRALDLDDFKGVDVVIGGPPCQGFSVAGKMDAHDPRSQHVWEFLRVVAALAPKIFVMENVKSLGTNTRWKSLRENLINSAKALGYDVELWNLKASDYGVPQNRERMFLVGSRVGKVSPPRKESKIRTSREALLSLPKFNTPGNDTLVTAKITLTSSPVLRKSAFAGMLFNGAGRPINLDRPSQTIPASIGGNKTPIVDQSWLDGGSNKWLIEYHDHLMSGGPPRDWQDVPSFLRRITAEEASALQGFPKGMFWAGSRSSVFRQIGNAVPPGLSQAVAKTIKTSLLRDGEPRLLKPRTLSIQEVLELGNPQLQFDI